MLCRYFLSPVSLVELNFQKSAKPKVNNAIIIWLSVADIIYNDIFVQLGAKSQPALLIRCDKKLVVICK